MANRNPYSEYGRTGNEDGYRREALLRALEEPEVIDHTRERQTGPDGLVDLTPDPNAEVMRPTKTPSRTPQQTREMLSGPGGQTTIAPDADAGGNDYSGPLAPELPDYTTRPPAGASTSNASRGYRLMDEYDDPYERRNEGAGGAGKGALKGASIGGSFYPGVGHVIGGVAGAIAGAFTRNAQSAMTDFAIDDAREIISNAYRDAFGRAITPQELDHAIRGQGWKSGDQWFGERPLSYILDQFAQNAQIEAAQRGANPAAAAAAPTTTAPAGATAGGMGGGLPFSGFDFGRAQDPSKSAKDAFAALAQKAPPMTDTSKAGAESWFRQHIAPGMEAAGYKIYDLKGDKAWVGSREDPEGRVPVDWLINAGGSNPQIGWQPESGGGTFAGGTGQGPSDVGAAYAYLKSIADPSMSRAEMEAAITEAFGNVPGFERGYAGDVVIGGRKIDLINNFEGANPQWSDNLAFVPLHGGGAGVSGGASNSGLNLSSLAPGVQLATPLGQSDANRRIQEEIQRILSGAPPRDALLAELGGA